MIITKYSFRRSRVNYFHYRKVGSNIKAEIFTLDIYIEQLMDSSALDIDN